MRSAIGVVLLALTLGCATMQKGWTVGEDFGLIVGGAVGQEEVYIKVGFRPQVTADAIKSLFGSDYGPDAAPPVTP